jgi:hypothetical protein
MLIGQLCLHIVEPASRYAIKPYLACRNRDGHKPEAVWYAIAESSSNGKAQGIDLGLAIAEETSVANPSWLLATGYVEIPAE